MAFFLVLAFAALAAAIAMAARRGLLALMESRREAWDALEEQLAKRQELAVAIVTLCARPLASARATVDRAALAARAVMGAARQRNVPALAAADAAHRNAFAELFAAAALEPRLAASEGFAALRERMATLDARVDERREAYNACASVLNFRCDAFPYSVMARLMGLRPDPLLP